MHRILRLSVFLLLATLSCHAAMAQDAPSQQYFIYIQNESGSPFYVKKKNDLLSSTQAGYIIIPRLTEGKYQLTIGLPGNQVPEASFDIELSGKGDKGFLLKAADKKLNLYALKDFSVVKPVAVASAAGNRIVDIPVEEPEKKPVEENAENADDLLTTKADGTGRPKAEKEATKPAEDTGSFAEMLNEITGKNTPVVAQTVPDDQQPKEDQPEDSSQPAAEAQPLAASDLPDSGVSTSNLPDSTAQAQPESKFDQLAGAILTDVAEKPAQNKPVPESKPSAGNNDISFITFPEEEKTENKPALVAEPSPAEITSAEDSAARQQEQGKLEKEQRRRERIAKREAKKTEDNDIDFSSMEPAPAVNSEPAEEPKNTPEEKKAKSADGIPNSDCRNLADEDQFQKFRRKMASRTDDEGIFRIAEKFLKDNVCYSSEQIQSLTYLFVSDEYKYKFLEMAYPHVYDSVHFPGLVKTLSSDYYKGRFKALVGR